VRIGNEVLYKKILFRVLDLFLHFCIRDLPFGFTMIFGIFCISNYISYEYITFIHNIRENVHAQI
jgi:hypothetical protein